MSGQGESSVIADELLEALKNLVGLAQYSGGKLHQYKAAIDDAKNVIERAERAA